MKSPYLLIAAIFLIGHSYAQYLNGKVELDNGILKIECKTDKQGHVTQHFYAKNANGNFTELVRSFCPDYKTHPAANSKLYNTAINPYRYQLLEILSSAKIDKPNRSIVLTGLKNGVKVKQTIRLQPNSNQVYIDVEVEFPQDENKLDFLLNTFELQLPHAPAFIHTPAMGSGGQISSDLDRSIRRIARARLC